MTTAPPAVRTLRNLVAGEWLDAGSAAQPLEDRAPADGRLLALVPRSDGSDVHAAVAAARQAQPAWAARPVLERTRAVMRLRMVLDDHREELAGLVSQDMGKTLDDARGEVHRGIESVEAACAVPEMMKGEGLEAVARGVDVELVRQPVGVVAAITPFNFPAMIPLWFLPFAIACGNTFVLKPSEQDPLTGERIAQLVCGIDEIPPGVVNLVHGGREAVDALLAHRGVDAVSFVGSAATAGHVASTATATGKRVQALGGAKNSMVVMPDADPRTMAEGVAASAFGAAGQRCLAGSVCVLVGHAARQDAARDAIVSAARSFDVPPLVSVAARERVEAEIGRAEGEGARVLLDGRTRGGEGGARLRATVLDGVAPESRAAREELFGPVLSLVRCPDLDAALDFVNGSRYGNAAVIFTGSGLAAREFRSRVEAGMVGVNVGVAAPVAWFPFAGWKDSFQGDLHANGRDAVAFYTRTKVVTSRWA